MELTDSRFASNHDLARLGAARFDCLHILYLMRVMKNEAAITQLGRCSMPALQHLRMDGASGRSTAAFSSLVHAHWPALRLASISHIAISVDSACELAQGGWSCIILSVILKTSQKVPFSPSILDCRCTHESVGSRIAATLMPAGAKDIVAD